MTAFEPDIGAEEPGQIEPAYAATELGVAQADDAEPELAESVVRGLLAAAAATAAMIDRHPAAPDLWRWRPDELDMLAPALTRAANRNPTLKRALLHGDWVVIALSLSGYTGRNLIERRQAIVIENQNHRSSGTSPAGANDQTAGSNTH